MYEVIILAFVTLLVTTVMHISFMFANVRILSYFLNDHEPSNNPLILIATVSAMVMGMAFLHVLGAIVWAIVYISLGEFDAFNQALYFSIVTATSLGFGDLTLSENWKLLSSLQAIGCFLLFSVSAAGLFQLMLNIFPTPVLLKKSKVLL